MGFFAFLLLGLIAGVIAKALLPGRNGAGWLLTLVLGVLGAVLGGWLGGVLLGVGLGDFFEIRTWLLAIAGAVIVFLIYGAATGGRRRRR
ncbi:GlsB/YeaQ/YmgE family stress response membrane protein [Cellulomonas sp. WB94]|uniref:GlsB/YeaQ/YmgE family stress response membrane protein n=1 Tax=Cellulomonas sp. WB94 TaxID=2173174 RepID=UPI000D572938|nr:GlsB/YeaQ/YmgE family stress response membrane protein [Cellulomonas sp. WB94]PVU83171.1 GlsB/YeaQ/YmgE family stress response membrane protein [Cellulomonas sp. WB94]